MACRTCGAYASEDVPTPLHCGDCPPWTCDQCGQMDSMASPCSCWISVESMPLADLKGLFAQAGLSVAGPDEDDV